MFFGALTFLRKSREAVSVILENAHIGEPWAVSRSDVLARHDDWNPGRVGNDANGHDSICQFIEWNFLGITGHEPLERLSWFHLRSWQGGICLRLPVALAARPD